jgi:antitoxin ParD1/3/4
MNRIVREALRDGNAKRQLMLDELAALKQDINKGLADVVAGHVKKFDANSIAEHGRRLLAARSV